MTENEYIYVDGLMPEQQTWYWTKPLQHPAAQPRAACWDRSLITTALVILAACALYTAADYGVAPQALSTSAHLSSPLGASHVPPLRLQSVISKVDLKAGLLEISIAVAGHPSGAQEYCSSSGTAVQHELVVGSTTDGAAQMVMPMCELVTAQQPIVAVLPLQRQALPHPFDEHTAEVRLRLQPEPAATPEQQQQHGGVDVAWTAVWAVEDLQVAVVQRWPSEHARLLAAVAGPYAGVDGVHDQLAVLHQPQGEVVFGVKFSHSSWLRVIHLAAALVQVLAVGWCCLLLLGHCMCAYLMQRFLCNRVHGVWN